MNPIIINQISLRVFLVCLVTCAALTLGIIWHADSDTLPPAYFQVTASLFVIGLASFLIWFSGTLGAIYRAVRKDAGCRGGTAMAGS